MQSQFGTARAAAPPFTWDDVWASNPETVHQGRWGNSTVLRALIGGETWAIKSYLHSPWIYRKTIGRFWANREYRIVSALEGIEGVPRNPCLLDRSSFCCGYETGRTLLDIRLRPVPVAKRFFVALENAVRQMHERGFCHLDLRNGRNILLIHDDKPVLLDFQSCLSLDRFPARVRRMMVGIDLSGVYKWWNRLSPETMDHGRYDFLLEQNKRRALWPFKGYGSWIRLWRAEPLHSPGKKVKYDDAD